MRAAPRGTLWLRGRAVVAGAIGAGWAGAVCSAAGAQQSSPAAALVFNGATIVDVVHGTLVPNQRVVIVGNHIQRVGAPRAVTVPTGAQVIDARGKYLIPGLWDMHVHPNQMATSYFHPLLLANGVTGIRDASSNEPLADQVQWRRDILAGRRIGPPRQLLSGGAVDASPDCRRTRLFHNDFAGHICVISDDTLDARLVVEELRDAGADMIKIYGNGMAEADFLNVAAAARRFGMPYGGHLYVPPLMASDSGWSIIDHYEESGRLSQLCGGRRATMDPCRSIAKRFLQHNTWWVPTLATHNGPTPASQALIERAQEFFRQLGKDSLGSARGLRAALRAARVPSRGKDSRVDSLGYLSIARRVGLPMLAGTDAPAGAPLPPGFSLHLELALEVAEGLTPLDALRTATLNPAKMWRATDSLGSIAPGKLADVVVLDADPLADILNTMGIHAVVANGRYFDRAMLDRVLREARAAVRAGR